MKPLFTLFTHLLFVGGMLVLYMLPNNKYDWMQEFDSAMSSEALEDPSANSQIFTVLLLIAIGITQTTLIVKSRNRLEKLLSTSFILIATIFWVFKFGL